MGGGLTFSTGAGFGVRLQCAGGNRREADEAGEIDLGFAVNLQRLAGMQDGVFRATVRDRGGRELGQDTGLGLLQEVEAINGSGHAWRLTEF